MLHTAPAYTWQPGNHRPCPHTVPCVRRGSKLYAHTFALSGRAVPRKPLFFVSCGTPSTQDLVGQAAGQGTSRWMLMANGLVAMGRYRFLVLGSTIKWYGTALARYGLNPIVHLSSHEEGFCCPVVHPSSCGEGLASLLSGYRKPITMNA